MSVDFFRKLLSLLTKFMKIVLCRYSYLKSQIATLKIFSIVVSFTPHQIRNFHLLKQILDQSGVSSREVMVSKKILHSYSCPTRVVFVT